MAAATTKVQRLTNKRRRKWAEGVKATNTENEWLNSIRPAEADQQDRFEMSSP